MSGGWHQVYFASDEEVPHRAQTPKMVAEWRIVRGRPVWIGAPISRAQFLSDVNHNPIDMSKYCDCELFFPVDEDTVEAVKGRRTQDRWVCRRMLAMD